MDDAVIIILTLLFTIFAAVNQNKKKKIPETAKVPDFWREPGKSQAPDPIRQEIHAAKKPLKTFPSRKVSAPFLQVETLEVEGVRNETVASILNKQAEMSGDTPEDDRLMDDFSLQKAIIYAEIIKPKYF